MFGTGLVYHFPCFVVYRRLSSLTLEKMLRPTRHFKNLVKKGSRNHDFVSFLACCDMRRKAFNKLLLNFH